MKRGIIILIVAAIVIVSLIVGSARRAMPVQAATVTRQTIQSFVDEPGTTQLSNDVLISMPFAGRVDPIDLEVGDPVTKGQLVARISEEDLTLELAESRAEVARLAALVAKSEDNSIEELALQQTRLVDQSMASTVEAAQQQLLAADARRKYARAQHGRIAALFRTGAQTQDDLDQAKLSLDEREYEYAQNALTLAALRTLKQAMELLPTTIEEYMHRRELDLAVARRALEVAQARLSQVELRAKRAQMTSPLDGVVLAKSISDEQFLAAGTELLRLGALDQLEVEAEVLSEDAVDIRAGDIVEIYGAAIGRGLGQGVQGHVDRVAPSGFTKISSLGVEQQRVRVVVHFDEGVLPDVFARVPLGVEYRVRTRIFVDQRSDALTVPRAALFRGADGGWQVFVVEKGIVSRQAVQIGLMNDNRAEVTSGLNDQAVVVLAPENNLEDGSRVDPLMRE